MKIFAQHRVWHLAVSAGVALTRPPLLSSRPGGESGGGLWGAAFSLQACVQEQGCVVLSDGSPTEQGVDHRQVQKELGQVSVYMQKPVVLSPSSAKISWTVSTNI